MIVALTGTPGTGKTRIARSLKKQIKIFDLGSIVKRKKLYSSYDKKMKSYVVDIKKFKRYFSGFKDDCVLDGHLSHMLPRSMIDFVIVLRCRPDILRKRLKKRKYSKLKVGQNLESEFIGLIAWEARKTHKKVFEIDTTNKSPRTVFRIVSSIIKKGGKYNKYKKNVDWVATKRFKSL